MLHDSSICLGSPVNTTSNVHLKGYSSIKVQCKHRCLSIFVFELVYEWKLKTWQSDNLKWVLYVDANDHGPFWVTGESEVTMESCIFSMSNVGPLSI